MFDFVNILVKTKEKRKEERNRVKMELLGHWGTLSEKGLFLVVSGNKEVLKTQKLLESLGFSNEGAKDSIIKWLNNFKDKRIIIYTKPYKNPKYSATSLEVFEVADNTGQVETSYKELLQIRKYLKG